MFNYNKAAKFTDLNSKIQLYDGNLMPCLGFGTSSLQRTEQDIEVICNAIKAGYRHFDTAQKYGCEDVLGEGLKRSGITREQFFITSKVWHFNLTPHKIRQSLKQTLKDLQTDYVDLYLIHWPRVLGDGKWQGHLKAAWQTLEQLQKEGRVKSIGVSNFFTHHLRELGGKIRPAVNQLEFHPGYLQLPLVLECKKQGIHVEAWSPLGKRHLRDNELIRSLALKYQRTDAQIMLRFILQLGVTPIPKSSHYERMLQNKEVFDFVLEPEDVKAIIAMPQTGWSLEHPDLNPAGIIQKNRAPL